MKINKRLAQFKDLTNNNNLTHASDKLNIVMGIDEADTPVIEDLNTIGNIFIAGTTGSGKSLFLETIIHSLISNHSTEEVKLVLMDMQRVQFPPYHALPHLLCPIVTNPKDAVKVLEYFGNKKMEMDTVFTNKGKAALIEQNKKLPHTVIIIDEFLEILLENPMLLEAIVVGLTGSTELSKFHLVVSTASPMAFTGEMLSGCARISFHQASGRNSELILGRGRIEAINLLGKGDMLLLKPGAKETIRIQAPFISQQESQERIDEIVKGNSTNYDPILTGLVNNPEQYKKETENDPLIEQAIEIIKETGKDSPRVIQLGLKVGYLRAVKLIEQAKLRLKVQ